MNKSDIAVRVEGLGKMYRLGREIPPAKTLGGKLLRVAASPFDWLASQMREPTEDEVLWALKDVSFEIKRGEVVGFIGHNGAGKSTLLKILSRITEPTTGHAEIHGRIAALLEVGTGMHPELTGRENIYMNGTVLGMKKGEIGRKFDEIIAFSGIEKFLDTPVKRYSSGMRVRLGFAIAAHLEPEILVVDEVLAVGDANFQKKCLGKMHDVASAGRTVLFVSHNMGAIRNLCPRAYVMHQGGVEFSGVTQAAIDEYGKLLGESSSESLNESERRSGSGDVRFVDFFVENTATETRAGQVFSGDDVTLVFVVEVKPDQVEQVDLGFSIHKTDGDPVTNLCSSFQGQYYSLTCGRHEVRCTVRSLSLAPGRLRVKGRITVCGLESDWPKEDLGTLNIEMGDFYGTGVLGQAGYAPCMLRGEWR